MRASNTMVTEIIGLAFRLFWRRMGLMLLANVVWLGLSLLILPWPAATAGLFYLMKRITAEELEADPQSVTLRDFWAGMRLYWLRGSALALGDLLVIMVIVVGLNFYGQSDVEPLRWLTGPIGLIGLAWAGAQLYLFPLFIERNQPILMTVRESFLMSISYPLNTLSLLLTALILGAGAFILAGPILLVFFSFLAMLQTIALRFILVRRGELALTITAEQREMRERQKG